MNTEMCSISRSYLLNGALIISNEFFLSIFKPDIKLELSEIGGTVSAMSKYTNCLMIDKKWDLQMDEISHDVIKLEYLDLENIEPFQQLNNFPLAIFRSCFYE